MKFNIGDKVRVIKAYGSASVGDEGIIRALPGKNGGSGAPFADCYSVEFPAWNKSKGHSCGGTVPSKNGLWILPECLEKIQSPAEKIVIISDGKTTTAKFYNGKEIVTTAEAKCSPDDKFDFTTGAQLAFERLFREVEKEPPKFDKSMLTTGRFGYMSGGQGWFVVVGDNLVYETNGFDRITEMNENGEFDTWRVECIIDSIYFKHARQNLKNGAGIVWMRPGFDPEKAV